HRKHAWTAARQRFQALQQHLVNAPETTIGENGHNVARSHFGRDCLHNFIYVANDASTPSLLLQLSRQSSQVQSLVLWNGFRFEYISHNYFVRYSQAPGQMILQNIAAKGIGSRLQDGPQACAGIASM